MSRDETISLTSEQRERANEMLEQLDGESEPQDFVDEWRVAPNRVGMEWKEEAYQYVPTGMIVGTEGHNVERLVPGRLRSVVEKLLAGKFEKEPRFPPALCWVDGEYFVDADGNHRVIAFKYIGIEEVYAEVISFY